MTAFAVSTNDSAMGWPLDYEQSEAQRPTVHVLDQGESPWVPVVIRRLRELASLPGGDPRGSRPMNPVDVTTALGFMQVAMRPDTVAPWIGLLNTGGLQINWRADDLEVEAIFDSTRDETVVYVTLGDQEWEEPVGSAYSLFGQVVDRLSPQDVEHPTPAT